MKPEYKKFYEQFGLNVVYYRKKKRLTQMKLANWPILTEATSVPLNLEMSAFLLM